MKSEALSLKYMSCDNLTLNAVNTAVTTINIVIAFIQKISLYMKKSLFSVCLIAVIRTEVSWISKNEENVIIRGANAC